MEDAERDILSKASCLVRAATAVTNACWESAAFCRATWRGVKTATTDVACACTMSAAAGTLRQVEAASIHWCWPRGKGHLRQIRRHWSFVGHIALDGRAMMLLS